MPAESKLNIKDAAQDILDVATGRKSPEVSIAPSTIMNVVIYGAIAAVFVVVVNQTVGFIFSLFKK
jgi:hypothetical protein